MADDSPAPAGDLAPWEQAIVELMQEEGELRDSGLWTHGRADYLGVLHRQRHELTHSRMIAWLLDPCAHHGLGSRVLRGLLEAVSPTRYQHLNRARTQLEQPLAGGRLDIVVTAPGLRLVIENKVDSEEGVDQCTYYSEYLTEETICVLLSPDGRPSRTPSTFKPLRNSELARILGAALKDTAAIAAAGHHVAEDYLRTVRREFP